MTLARRCVNCGDPIPGELRRGTRFCKRKCQKDWSRRGGQPKRQTAEPKRESRINRVELGARLRQIEEQARAEFRASRFSDPPTVGDRLKWT